eukprot:CAMPEP_0201524008 /NCGR_PEP_ID=MMETSP0161_2-20130828/21056_1 /ASSEMBLY_ACC=CAM_ASM_000251 /TAXON_ID=180227 /ORGANISM="Neoparamoeba aestuarina, Strain SoJaBio B1-5/56/2" /LENGTH=383 /DNA_ID=CAMNT_0047923263 /DNA_START=18 /DNA_END=1169 /DNA_ORIENTATION=+
MTQGGESRRSVDEEGNYSMIHLQNQEALEGVCWNSKVKTGLVLFFVVGLCVALILTIILPLGEESVERKYYLSCEAVNWNYTPLGKNIINDREFTTEEERQTGSAAKARYVEYTDDSFSETEETDPSLGIMGPVIRAKVGDTITVILKNFLDEECGIHVHGLQYKRSQEAEEYLDSYEGEEKQKRDETGPSVPPGETYEYKWSVPERSGPGANEGTSKGWMYHAPLSASMNPNSGLFGMVAIAGQYSATEAGLPNDIQNEVFVALVDFNDENDGIDDSEEESNMKYTINGYTYGNNRYPISIPSDETTRWYIASLSLTSTGQSIYWHGNTVSSFGSLIDVLFIPSTSVKTVDMGADNAGVWLFSTTEAKKPGMQALYRVESDE